jgi:hypothetical protein
MCLKFKKLIIIINPKKYSENTIIKIIFMNMNMKKKYTNDVYIIIIIYIF